MSIIGIHGLLVHYCYNTFFVSGVSREVYCSRRRSFRGAVSACLTLPTFLVGSVLFTCMLLFTCMTATQSVGGASFIVPELCTLKRRPFWRSNKGLYQAEKGSYRIEEFYWLKVMLPAQILAEKRINSNEWHTDYKSARAGGLVF